MLYHIDRQLKSFINAIETEFGAENCLWALTADHGSMPIPERLQAQGRLKAQRLDSTALQKDLNRALYQKYNVKNLITTILGSHIYLHPGKVKKIGTLLTIV